MRAVRSRMALQSQCHLWPCTERWHYSRAGSVGKVTRSSSKDFVLRKEFCQPVTSEADRSAASSSHLLVGGMCKLGCGEEEAAAKALVPLVLLTPLKKNIGVTWGLFRISSLQL